VKSGDMVRVIDHSWRNGSAPQVWHDFMGECGIILTTKAGVHFEIAVLLIKNEIAEFDMSELEVVNES
jgi:hypothetical protein